MKRTLLFIACVMTSITMLAQVESNDYIPFVELGKQWHLVSSVSDDTTNYYFIKYQMNEEEEHDGKTYFQVHHFYKNAYDEEYGDASYGYALLREENRRVYMYDQIRKREIMLYDFTLKEGDTFTYEYRQYNCKVLKQGWLEDGPQIVTSSTLTSADTLDIKYRRLRTWTIGREIRPGEYYEYLTWVEGAGTLDNMFCPDCNGAASCLAYIERKDNETDSGENEYLPFSFYNTYGLEHGCDLPTGAENNEEDEWSQHHLTYELVGDSLHVYGDVFSQCGPNNYAYFIEKTTDDPKVRKIEFQIQEVAPVANCMALHATDFYVPGFDPNINYIVVDNHLVEHPVINKTPQDEYRPFVEDNKVWKVGSTTMIDSLVKMVEYFYFEGDTIIDGKTCKQMMCQQFVSPDYPGYDIILQYTMQRYVGAWYEEDKKVYAYDSIGNQFKLMYDFSVNANDTLQINGQSYMIGARQAGGMKGFKGVYRDVWECRDKERIYRCAPWLEGVGVVYGLPTISIFNVELGDPAWLLMSCTVGDEVIYLNDDYEDGVIPEGVNAPKRRFDFTHTTKSQPKAPRRSEEQSLYGEYNNLLLDINLDPLSEAYLVRITDETGKVVYEKAINAGSIVALNIDISAYAAGRYTVTVENSQETFTGEFEAQTTGIEEVKSKRLELRDYIYNLQGQRLNTLQRGLNIVNGKKVYVK